MVLSTTPLVKLNEHLSIPQLGFGTYRIRERAEMEEAIQQALNVGYRLFDTAQLYQNELELGLTLKDSGYNREDYFIASKVHNDNQGYDHTLRSFEQSLTDLQTDYLDIFYVHWPLSNTFFETWKALEWLYEQKVIKAIGVCNFTISHLDLLTTKANIKPMINQIELHPYLTQEVLIQYLRQEEIAVQAWSPIVKGKVQSEPTLIELGKKYNKSPAQITLRWHIQNGYIAIPKSSNPNRIQENMSIFDFALSTEEMQLIAKLNRNERLGRNPDDVYRNNGF